MACLQCMVPGDMVEDEVTEIDIEGYYLLCQEICILFYIY